MIGLGGRRITGLTGVRNAETFKGLGALRAVDFQSNVMLFLLINRFRYRRLTPASLLTPGKLRFKVSARHNNIDMSWVDLFGFPKKNSALKTAVVDYNLFLVQPDIGKVQLAATAHTTTVKQAFIRLKLSKQQSRSAGRL